MSDTLFDIYQNVGSAKELWDQLESKYMAEDAYKESLREKESGKGKGKEIGGSSSVNMIEDGKYKNNNKNSKGNKRKNDGNNDGSNKKSKLTCWNCGKTGHLKKDCRVKKNNGENTSSSGQGFKDPNSSQDEALDKFKIDKTEVELQQNDLIKILRMDKGGEYYDPLYFQFVGIIHATTTAYTSQQNGVFERRNRALKEMVNSMLSYSGLSEGFWGEAMLMACYLLNRVPNKRNKVTPYELWYKKQPNFSYLRVWGCKAVVRLPKPKRKILGEKGIDWIFIGYVKHSKAYRFYVIEPNEYISVNSVIESRDAMFDEKRSTSIPRPKSMMPSSNEDQIGKTPTTRRSNRARVAKSFGSDFQLYLVEGLRDEIGPQYSYCYIIEEDPRTFDEAMQSRDIFKRKMKVDGTIDKFKARLVIQGFRQKERIDYFDTYAPVARISTIRLLIALVETYNLVIHQMVVKTTFLNGDLEEEVYMKQPEGFIIPGNEHKVCKLIKSLYGLKQAPKRWHQIFDEVVLSSGFVLNQSDKCVYCKFDKSGKGVIIYFYVDIWD
ncbi:zinc finger, CCHC-type containing protein [Tanacetum coccineum]